MAGRARGVVGVDGGAGGAEGVAERRSRAVYCATPDESTRRWVDYKPRDRRFALARCATAGRDTLRTD